MLCTGFWVCSVISHWICRSFKVILFYFDNYFFNTLCLYFTILFRKNKLLVCYILNNFIENLYTAPSSLSSIFQSAYFSPFGCFQCFGNFFHKIGHAAPKDPPVHILSFFLFFEHFAVLLCCRLSVNFPGNRKKFSEKSTDVY